MTAKYEHTALCAEDKSSELHLLKAHCHGCDWLVVILKLKTKLSPLSNYPTCMLLDHTLF